MFVRYVEHYELEDELRRLSPNLITCCPFAAAYNRPGYAKYNYDENLAEALTAASASGTRRSAFFHMTSAGGLAAYTRCPDRAGLVSGKNAHAAAGSSGSSGACHGKKAIICSICARTTPLCSRTTSPMDASVFTSRAIIFCVLP